MKKKAHFIDDNVGFSGCYALSDPWAPHPVVNRHICYMGGGGSGGGGQQTTTTRTETELSPEQRKLIDAASPALIHFAQNPPKDYEGPRIAEFNPNQQQAQQMALGAAAGPVQSIANRANDTSAFLSGPNLFAESNPYLRSAMDAAIRPQVQTFGETIMPSIRTGAANSGQFGGSRQGIAEGIAARGLSDSIASTVAPMANANYQKGQDSLTQALQMMPLIQQMQLAPASVIGGVGSQQQGMEQALINDEVQRFMTAQMLPYLAAKDVASVAFGMPGGATTSTSTGPAAYQPNTTGQDIMGYGSLGLGALSVAAMFM